MTNYGVCNIFPVSATEFVENLKSHDRETRIQKLFLFSPSCVLAFDLNSCGMEEKLIGIHRCQCHSNYLELSLALILG